LCLLCGCLLKLRTRNSMRDFAAFTISEQWSTNLDFLNPLITMMSPNYFEIKNAADRQPSFFS
jgi:hypothetical protein